MDKKLQFIDLANTIAHDNTVLLPVQWVLWQQLNKRLLTKHTDVAWLCLIEKQEIQNAWGHTAAGAYVAFPKKGIHEWVGSMDLNSLYPSVFRALNMGAETVVGQLRQDYTNEEIRQDVIREKIIC